MSKWDSQAKDLSEKQRKDKGFIKEKAQRGKGEGRIESKKSNKLGKVNWKKEWEICRCNTSKSKSVHSRTLYSVCFWGKSLFFDTCR